MMHAPLSQVRETRQLRSPGADGYIVIEYPLSQAAAGLTSSQLARFLLLFTLLSLMDFILNLGYVLYRVSWT